MWGFFEKIGNAVKGNGWLTNDEWRESNRRFRENVKRYEPELFDGDRYIGDRGGGGGGGYQAPQQNFQYNGGGDETLSPVQQQVAQRFQGQQQEAQPTNQLNIQKDKPKVDKSKLNQNVSHQGTEDPQAAIRERVQAQLQQQKKVEEQKNNAQHAEAAQLATAQPQNDRGRYYESDAAKLRQELAKGDQANEGYIRGLTQSLKNRANELGSLSNREIDARRKKYGIDDGKSDFQRAGEWLYENVIEDPVKATAGRIGTSIGMLDDKTKQSVQEELLKANEDYKAGRISKDKLKQILEEKVGLDINNQVKVGDNGLEHMNELERLGKFAGDFTDAGVKASQFVPVATGAQAGSKAAQSGTRAWANALGQTAKEAAITGTADTVNDALHNKVTPEGTAANYLAPIGLGMLGRMIGKAASSADDDVVRAIKNELDEEPKFNDRAKVDEPELNTPKREDIKAKIDEDPRFKEASARNQIDDLNLRDREARPRVNDEVEANTPVKEDVPQEATKDASPVEAKAIEQAETKIDNDPNMTPKQKEEAKTELEQRSDELTEEINQNKASTDEAVAKQEKELNEKTQELSDDIKQAREQQAAETTPVEGVQQKAPAQSSEVQANNAYDFDAADAAKRSSSDLQDDLMRAMGYDIDGKARNSVVGKTLGLLPRIQQALGNKLSDATNEAISKGINSRNKITSTLAQAPRNVWSMFGRTDAERAALNRYKGQINNAGAVVDQIAARRNKAIEKAGKETGWTNPQIREMVDRVFESPEVLAYRYGADHNYKITPDQLPASLRSVVEESIQLNKLRNEINHNLGIINDKTYEAFKDGMHTPRMYDIDFSTGKYGDVDLNRLDKTAGIDRLKWDKIDDAVKDKLIDPFSSQDARLKKALENKAKIDAANDLFENIASFKTRPNSGFVQLKGKQYGKLEGRWVDREIAETIEGHPIFKSDIAKSTQGLIDSYQNSKLGKLDRAGKWTKTVGSPGTHVGNIGSNLTLFSTGAGIDPATAAARALGAARDLMGNKVNADIYKLRKAGILGGDTGRALRGAPEKEALKINSLLTQTEKPSFNTLRKALGGLESFYGGTDEAFKLATYRELKARGYSDDAAMRVVREQFQDYDNVGRAINMVADSPVLGKPFARFIPELGRITKNTAKNNPLGLAAGVGGLALASDAASKAAGETEAERNAREEAVGQTRIPLTSLINKALTGRNKDVSLNIPVGDSSVNIARAVGMNFPITPDNKDATSATIDQLNPLSLPFRKNAQGDTVFAPEQAVSSLTFRPIADELANRDFMGRQIDDPKNKVIYEKDGKNVTSLNGKPSEEEQRNNRLRHLAMSYLPFANEVDAIGSAATKGEDYYGKKRDLGQAVARALGFKVESNDKDARQKRIASQNYYEDNVNKVNDFLKQNPDLVDAYFKINNPTKDRETGRKVGDVITPEKWDVVNSDTSGRLFNFMKEQAVRQFRADGKPIDPIFKLTPQQAKYVSELRSRPTGEDEEAKEILRATEPWYQQFEQAQNNFYKAQAEYYKSKPSNDKTMNERVKAYQEASMPVEQPEAIKQYYQIKASDPAAAKTFYANNQEQLKSAFEKYNQDRLVRVNAMRRIEGYPPLSPEVYFNKSFGFDANYDQNQKRGGFSRGGGFARGGFSRGGFGGGRSGGGGRDNPYEKNALNDVTTTQLTPVYNPTKPKEANLNILKAVVNAAKAGSGGSRTRAKLGASATGRSRKK